MSFSAGRIARGVLLQLAVIGFSYAPGCSGDHDEVSVPDDVVLDGTATDEALANLLAAPTKEDAARAPVFTAPTTGAKLPSAPAARFAWNAPVAEWAPSARPRGAIPWMPFGPMRLAHAHGTPMSGRAYLLTFKSGSTNLVRVFTTNTSYTPDAATWNKLVSARSVTATLATASFDNNNVLAGSGPFVGATTGFSIEP